MTQFDRLYPCFHVISFALVISRRPPRAHSNILSMILAFGVKMPRQWPGTSFYAGSLKRVKGPSWSLQYHVAWLIHFSQVLKPINYVQNHLSHIVFGTYFTLRQTQDTVGAANMKTFFFKANSNLMMSSWRIVHLQLSYSPTLFTY